MLKYWGSFIGRTSSGNRNARQGHRTIPLHSNRMKAPERIPLDYLRTRRISKSVSTVGCTDRQSTLAIPSRNTLMKYFALCPVTLTVFRMLPQRCPDANASPPRITSLLLRVLDRRERGSEVCGGIQEAKEPRDFVLNILRFVTNLGHAWVTR